ALADERICIGPAAAAQSYLNMQNILSAALATHAEAIHPGYGFLSENSMFAELCAKNDVVFIGPESAVIDQMGNKDQARRLMIAADVPIIPGSGIVTAGAQAKIAGSKIGYPLLVKACAGGGGKGIRIVEREADLEKSVMAACEEAKKAFGCGDVFLEKYLTSVRHVEVQILADHVGNVVCLGERDCSLQIGRQKVIEETPCPVLEENIRRRLHEAARKAVKAAKYTNAGTVEFLLAPDGNFYFIEMNTRLQVEHRISEEVSAIDLVKWQIRVASQIELPFKQEDIRLRGASIECRINATGSGKVSFLHIPGGNRVSFDTALTQDTVVTPFYDSLLGKLITAGNDREEAVRKMEASLCELVISGVATNIEQQLEIIRSPQFRTGQYDTAWLQTQAHKKKEARA
ncbi:MAG: ATP-grasp domain-containing protein, partial [Clostridia bacterium]|nr:ATP-grasp domain-containing protein [Clostridia bacterium]